ncbi:MAG: hypothetical protein IPK79_08320 [Vampirovibrionales bacterium]|nr:hypothetical protein [Vampirovibrionales bacterium]
MSDIEMKQLFHAIDLERYGINDAAKRAAAAQAEDYALQKLKNNAFHDAERTSDGNVKYRGMTLTEMEARYAITLDMEHFHKTDTRLSTAQLQEHLKALQSKSTSSLEGARRLAADLASAAMLMSTGLLKGATLGYADFIDDAKRTSQIIGANSAIAENPYFNPQTVGDVIGMGLPAGKVFEAAARTSKLASGAIAGATIGGVQRREGELAWETQLAAGDRLVDTAIGAGAGAALVKLAYVSKPVFEAVVQRFKQVTGFRLPVDGKNITLNEFLNRVKNDQGMTQHELDFLIGKTNVPPHNSPYRLGEQRVWTKGGFPNFMDNLEYHGDKHLPEFSEIYPKDYTYYGDVAHSFRGNLPTGTELKITPNGQRLYYHESSNIFMVQDANGVMQSIYRPKLGRQWFDTRTGTYYGKFK